MEATTTTVQALAKEAAQCFETAHRGDDPERPYICLCDSAPAWVHELVYTAHGDFGPDDWRYQVILAACETIHDQAEAGNEPYEYQSEFADGQIDVYTGERLHWLASNLNRPDYCDEATAELGQPSDIVEMVGQGQYMEASEIYGLVMQYLETRAAS